MELAHVILGPVVTEKAESLKGTSRTHTLKVSPRATKIDVKNAMKKFYDIDVDSVRIMRTTPKTRRIGRGGTMEKRHRTKKAMVTLSKESKNFDLANFKTR